MNPVVRRFRDGAVGKWPEVLVAEGVKLVDEALEAGLEVVEAAFSERLEGSELGRAVLQRLEGAAPQLHRCAPAVMARLSAVKTPPGVVVVFRRPQVGVADLLGNSGAALVVVAAGLRDPGNLGALARTAEGAGATGLVALEGGADPWREKAVRGSAGSVFRLPVVGGMPASAVAALCGEHGLQVVLADGDSADSYLDVDFRQPTALVMGGEAQGVPCGLELPGVRRVKVPMAPPVDSLNVAVATGVLLFEARRQRT